MPGRGRLQQTRPTICAPVRYLRNRYGNGLAANWHTFQVLTKRSSLMTRAKNAVRLEHLRVSQASVKFVSFEPLLGSVGDIDLRGINWAIVGGESGPRARPMAEEWAIEIRDQCRKANVAFFFKQWGGVRPKAGGRLLCGREWNQYPQVESSSNLEAIAAE
jgi:protein gp37